MGFRLLLIKDSGLPETVGVVDAAAAKIRAAISDMHVDIVETPERAGDVIADADAAFGEIGPDLFAMAKALRWIQSPRAGPNPKFYHPALVESDVVVTNMRGIFSDHIAAHILAFVLGFSRGLHIYHDRQRARRWQPGAPTVFLPEATVLIVGIGAIGAETARLCAEFDMTVLAVDPRVTESPPGVSVLSTPDRLDAMLPRADFVVVTAPETPATQGLFTAARFALMKPDAFFINIGRGATVVLDDLDEALRAGTIGGAALDVFQTEPLPADHPLWDAPGMVITPHVATAGPHLDARRVDVLVENCTRFAAGRDLINVVDKANWF